MSIQAEGAIHTLEIYPQWQVVEEINAVQPLLVTSR
jgi:hypothetical protein